MGAPIPVVPLTIEQYMDVISHLYDNSGDMDEFIGLLKRIAESTVVCNTYQLWEENIRCCIKEWKVEKKVPK